MNKLPDFSVWIVLATIMILPMSGANAVPPGGAAADLLEMQATLAEISEQIKGLLRVSSVQNVSGVRTNDPQGLDTLEMGITTSEEGPFIIIFTAQTSIFGPISEIGKGSIVTFIKLDDAFVNPSPSQRRDLLELGNSNEVNWTATVVNVQPGEHMVKINFSCSVPNSSETCADLGIEASLLNNAQLTVIHPM